MKRSLTASLLIVVLISTTHAEIAPKSKAKLQAGSTHVVIGTVQAIYTEQTKADQWLKTAGVVEIRVSRLEKGDKIESGDAVYARFWRQQWAGQGNPPPFGSGHRLPEMGDTVRVYLERKDGGHDALLPNGFEVISKMKETNK